MAAPYKALVTQAIVARSIRRSVALLSPRDRRRFMVVLALQFLAGVLDIVGVLLFAFPGTLAVIGPDSLDSFGPHYILVSGYLPQGWAAMLAVGLVAWLFLAAKGFLYSKVVRLNYRFLASRQSLVAEELVCSLFNLPPPLVDMRSS